MVGGLVTGAPWRTAFASVIGTSHVRTKTPCQDAGLCIIVIGADGAEILVAAVSDGAGTAARSDIGAALAVDRFIRDFAEAARAAPDLAAIDRDFAVRWLTSTRQAIAGVAEEAGDQLRDYACTLLGAVIGATKAAYFQIGDGAIIVSRNEPGEYAWVFWPQHGEFANTTNFLTQDDAELALAFENDVPPVNQVAIFSDGIERLVLDWSAHTVHSPAFHPIFEWLATTEPGAAGMPSDALIAYLGSDRVNSRTDDDKTLVMASRAAPRRPET